MMLTPPRPTFSLMGEFEPTILHWERVDMGRNGQFLMACSTVRHDGWPLEWWIHARGHKKFVLFADEELCTEVVHCDTPRMAIAAAMERELKKRRECA